MIAENLRAAGALLLAGGIAIVTSVTMTGCKDDDTGTTPVTKTAVTVKIEDDEIDITPSALKAGPTLFTIKNAGSIDHTFEIEQESTAKEFYNKTLSVGQTDTVSVTLTEGVWEFYDPHHKDDGVDHDITVTK